jgi:vacuolar iron transporter family protein
LWTRTMALEEYGLSPNLRSPLWSALSTFTAFLICGAVPLMSYFSAGGLFACTFATGLTFFAVGAVKSLWSPAGWLRSGLETLIIGMSAAGMAFAVGYAMRAGFNLSPA